MTPPICPVFLAWARQFGYVPGPMTKAHQRHKLARYWLAWQAGVPPDCKKAHLMVQLSGLLT